VSSNARQKALYTHTCLIISVTETIIAGKPLSATFAVASSKVPCHYEYTDNINSPVEGGAEIKRATIFTTDKIHMSDTVVLEDGWIIVNTTRKPDGSKVSVWGEVHKILGAPRVTPASGRRNAAKQSVDAMTMDVVPSALTLLIAPYLV